MPLDRARSRKGASTISVPISRRSIEPTWGCFSERIDELDYYFAGAPSAWGRPGSVDRLPGAWLGSIMQTVAYPGST
jgi:hypothetical protein